MRVRQVNNIYENNSSIFRKVRLVLYTEQSKTELEFQGLVEDETYEPAGDYPDFSGNLDFSPPDTNTYEVVLTQSSC